MTVFKKGLRTFNLTGRLRLTNNSFNIDKRKDGSNYIYSNANLSLDCGNGNVFCSLVGGHFATGDNVIYALGTKVENGKVRTDYTNQLRIKYEDRNNLDKIKDVSLDSFVVFNIERDADGKLISKKFLSKEDGVKYLQSVLSDGMVLNISGDISFRVDTDGKTLFTLNIKRIYLNTKENPVLHSNFILSVLSSIDSYDTGSVADENGMIDLHCYVTEYMKEYRGVEKSIVPLPFVIYMDTHNDNWKKIIHEYFRPQSKFLAETVIEGNIVSQGNLQTVTLEDQSDDIKQLVELGVLSVDELAKVGANNNSLVQKMVFTRPYVSLQDGKVVITCDKEKYSVDDLILEKEISKPETEKETSNDELFAELFGN